MKNCAHCGKEFLPNPKQPTKVYCRERCKDNAAKKRYHQKRGWGSSARRKRNKERRAALAKRNRDYLYEVRKAGCSRCPERRPSCLDFHHIDRSTKLAEVGRMASRGTFEKLLAEIAKCILLCANCHRVEEMGDGFKPPK